MLQHTSITARVFLCKNINLTYNMYIISKIESIMGRTQRDFFKKSFTFFLF